MQKFKKILALSVVGLSAIVSVFLILNSRGNQTIFGVADSTAEPLTENNLLDILGVNLENTLTGTYIQKLIENLQTANPEGIATINDNFAPNIPDVKNINQWLKENQNKIDINSLKPAISDQDLAISEDQNPKAVSNYINQYRLVFDKHFSSLPSNINLNIETSAFNDFLKLINWASGQLVKINKDLLALPAPRNVLSFHKDLIRNNAAEAALYDIVANYQKDPVKTMMAMPLRSEIIKEKQAIIINLANFLKKLDE